MKYKIENDYIMTSPLSRFDDYTIYDLMGIESDLNDLISDNEIDYNVKGLICDRYEIVINHIRERLENGNKT